MSLFRLTVQLGNLLAASALLLQAQTPSDQAIASTGPNGNAGISRAEFAEPAVPADPLELVTGDAQAIQTAEQRAAIANMLANAHALSNVRAFPYYRKTAFLSYGGSSSDGSWQLEDTSPGSNLYRWSAQGPGYSAIHLFDHRMLYSNQPGVSIPVRLAQVRSAIFFTRPVVGPRATLRTATASLNGAALTCILLSHMGAAKGATGGRRWAESEYCIENASGALILYSAVPGLYVYYDYSQAIRFHDRVIPNRFTINQAGHTIIEAQTLKVSDPPDNPSLFQPDGLNQVGVGFPMTAPATLRRVIPSPIPPPGSSQVVAIHGMRSATGEITDLELLASSNSALNQTALELASKWQSETVPDDPEPGATPQSHEVLITLTFAGIQR